MRILSITLLAAFFALCSVRICSAHEEPPKTLQEKQKIENTRLKYRKAAIRKVLCYKYNYIKGEKQLPKLRTFESTYDTNGCITELSVFRNDTLTSKTLNYYNADFQMVTGIDFGDGRTYSGVDRYEYSDAGFIQLITELSATYKTLGRIEYLYNPAKLNIQLIRYDSTDMIEYSVEYNYANDIQAGLCKSIIKKDRKGVMQMRVENIYNPDGSRKEKRIYKADNKLDYYFQYTYLPSGDVSEISKINADGTLVNRDKYIYNEQGFVTSIASFDSKNEILSMLEYTYYMPAR